MGLFNKKATVEKPTVDELLKAIAQLSDKEKEKLYTKAFGEVDEPSDRETAEVLAEETADGETETTEVTEETSEGTDDNEQTETEPEEPAERESGERETNADTDEVTQNTEERHEDVVATLTARLETLEQTVEEFREIINDIADLSNGDSPLGASAQANIGSADDDMAEDDRIMSAYNPNWRRG